MDGWFIWIGGWLIGWLVTCWAGGSAEWIVGLMEEYTMKKYRTIVGGWTSACNIDNQTFLTPAL
jgi:hypothetical protein